MGTTVVWSLRIVHEFFHTLYNAFSYSQLQSGELITHTSIVFPERFTGRTLLAAASHLSLSLSLLSLYNH